jgi:hypothetical protein
MSKGLALEVTARLGLFVKVSNILVTDVGELLVRRQLVSEVDKCEITLDSHIINFLNT